MRTSFNGAVEATFTSMSFGDAFATVTGSDGDPYHYASQDHDYPSDTEHAQFRQYSSTPGRWMSPDPSSGSYHMRNPQSFNRYTYALNNPVRFVDPKGLDVGDDTPDPEDDICADVVCFADTGDASDDDDGGGGGGDDQQMTSPPPSLPAPTLPTVVSVPPQPVSVIQVGSPISYNGVDPSTGVMPGTTFVGNIYTYDTVDANGNIVTGDYTVTENITPIDGNIQPDALAGSIWQPPIITDWVGITSGPNGTYQSGSLYYDQIQTFSANFPNGISAPLSTVVIQSVSMQNGVLSSATATVMIP
jgi:RHS repeat-associated protein